MSVGSGNATSPPHDVEVTPILRPIRAESGCRPGSVHCAAPAPVAQGIEHRPPEPGAQVRFLPGALPSRRSAAAYFVSRTSYHVLRSSPAGARRAMYEVPSTKYEVRLPSGQPTLKVGIETSDSQTCEHPTRHCHASIVLVARRRGRSDMRSTPHRTGRGRVRDRGEPTDRRGRALRSRDRHSGTSHPPIGARWRAGERSRP